jgi:hypothetical protein
MLNNKHITPGYLISSESFSIPAVRVKDCSEKPTARAGRGGKGKRGLVTESLTAASTSGGNALVIQKSKIKIQKLEVLPEVFSGQCQLQTPYIDPLLRFLFRLAKYDNW